MHVLKTYSAIAPLRPPPVKLQNKSQLNLSTLKTQESTFYSPSLSSLSTIFTILHQSLQRHTFSPLSNTFLYSHSETSQPIRSQYSRYNITVQYNIKSYIVRCFCTGLQCPGHHRRYKHCHCELCPLRIVAS